MKRFVVGLLTLLLMSAHAAVGERASGQARPQQQRAADDEEVVRVSTALVTVPVSVLDRQGRFVPGLRKEDFRVFEDGVEQEVAYFESAERPFTVALVVDTSDSVVEHLEEIKRAALAFLEELRPEDRVMLVAFDNGVRLVTDPTTDRAAVRAAVGRMKTGAGTSLYDAVALTLGERLSRERGRKAVVLLTDGVDNASRAATYAGTLEAAEEAEALFYPVQYDTFGDLVVGGLGASFQGVLTTNGTSPATGERESLRQSYDRANRYLRLLASKTGGDFYYAGSTKNLAQTFATVARRLREQYSLGYYPKRAAAEAPPKHHALAVRVGVRGLAVRTRRGYVGR